MPGDLEAPPILPNTRAYVKTKTLISQRFLLSEPPPPSRCQGRRRRRSAPLTPALATGQRRQQSTKAPAPPGPSLQATGTPTVLPALQGSVAMAASPTRWVLDSYS